MKKMLIVTAIMVLLCGCGGRTNKANPKNPAAKNSVKATPGRTGKPLIIDDLAYNFSFHGMDVKEYKPSAKVKERLEKDMKAGEDTAKPLEEGFRKIDGITVRFFRYDNPYKARTMYEKTLESQGKGKGRRFRTEYLMKGPFVMSVRHWEFVEEDGVLKKKELSLDEKKLKKIRKIFSSYSPREK